MKRSMTRLAQLLAVASLVIFTTSAALADDAPRVSVTVKIENIAPEGGVAITPVWVGFHSGSFDSYNGGLRSLPGLERVAEDGDNSLLSKQFNDFDPERGGYTYIDNSGAEARSKLARTGDLSDVNRVDANLGSAPLLPGQSASETFELVDDGSNDFFSYASMVLPTNDFFIANGNPRAHDISGLLMEGGATSFLIGAPNGGVNDAGTERENFRFSAGNGLFPDRNLPAGQTRANQGQRTKQPIENVVGPAFERFRLISSRNRRRVQALRRTIRIVQRLLRPFASFPPVAQYLASLEAQIEAFEASVTIDVNGFDFNQYEGGIARVTITATPQP